MEEWADKFFWPKVMPTGFCWYWTASRLPNGYGQFSSGRSLVGTPLAHRVAYMLLVDEVPDGLQLDHLCRNKVCVNPDHLEPVAPAVNQHRRIGKKVKKWFCDEHGIAYVNGVCRLHVKRLNRAQYLKRKEVSRQDAS